MQFLVLEFLPDSANLGLGCPKAEIQQKTFDPRHINPSILYPPSSHPTPSNHLQAGRNSTCEERKSPDIAVSI